MSVLSDVAALVLFQLCCLKKGHLPMSASQILFLVADEMEIFSPFFRSTDERDLVLTDVSSSLGGAVT